MGSMVFMTMPNSLSINLAQELNRRGNVPTILCNNPKQVKKIRWHGQYKTHIVDMETNKHVCSEAAGSKVFLFEESFSLTCYYLKIIQEWRPEFVSVISKSKQSRPLYRHLGADEVFYTDRRSQEQLLLQILKHI